VTARPAPNIVVGILDRDEWDANTDNLVVVQPGRRRLTWVPRDLWSEAVGDRVNRAFAVGGLPLLLEAVAGHGLDPQGAVVLRRGAAERFLGEIRVTVPVRRPLRFLYPLTPTARIDDGAKIVGFDPPAETLEGERLHQWIGARRVPNGAGSDLDRIARQQLALRALLEQGTSFDSALADASRVASTGNDAVEALRSVRSTWSFAVVDDVVPRTRDAKAVLVRDHGPAAPLRSLRRALRRRLV
jgi:hypothetical protein